tara:strand:+ start:73 stop:531 length:459 start_codon:yes stop_codon:yes gene_type:complete
MSTQQKLKKMSKQQLRTMHYIILQEALDKVTLRLNRTRKIINELIQAEESAIVSFAIDGDVIDEVLPSSLIKWYRLDYAVDLCNLRFLTNFLSNTLTQAHFDALHEKLTDQLELMFELFGMKHHKKWSKTFMDDFEVHKDRYDIYKGLYNIH